MTNFAKLLSERIHLRAPFGNLMMVTVIRGNVPASELLAALRKIMVKHPLLTSSVQVDKKGKACFRLGEHSEPILTLVPGKDGQWQEIFLKEERRPVDLKKGPLFRSILLPGKEGSIFILVCHHISSSSPR
jgi:hypothetical protein